MFIFLLFLAIVLFYLISTNEGYESRRERIILVFMGLGLWVSLSTELLSLLKTINRPSIIASWIIFDIILATILFLRPKNTRVGSPTHLPDLSNISKANKSLLVGGGGILSILFLTALFGYPNTPDGLTYHMPRIMHWLQNGSLAHYPTHITRQLYMPPFTEIVFLHIKCLYGGDGLLNLVPWLAMLGCGIGVSKIVKEFGGGALLQIFGFVICITLPIGIMKSTSVKNDLVLTFFLLSLIYFLLKSLNNPQSLGIKVGIALGLAIFVKGTAYLYAFPFMIWWGIAKLRQLQLNIWKPLLTVVLAVLILNLGHYVRNFNLYGSPTAVESSARKDYTNDVVNVKVFLSNVVRNISNHLGTPSQRVNNAIEEGVIQFHEWIGQDVNDPRTTFEEHEYHVERIANNAALAQNFLHLVLIFSGILLFLIRGSFRQYPKATTVYGICVLSSFLFFSLFLKWQISHTRLLTPMFILWAPFISFALRQYLSSKWIWFVSVILMIGALPWTLYNFNRPFLLSVNEMERRKSGAIEIEFDNVFNRHRKDKFFNVKPNIAPFKEVGEKIKATDCSNIALVGDRTTNEYLLWVVLDNHRFDRKYTIKNLFVENTSALTRDSFKTFHPCLYILDKNADSSKKTALMSHEHSKNFEKILENEYFILYK